MDGNGKQGQRVEGVVKSGNERWNCLQFPFRRSGRVNEEK